MAGMDRTQIDDDLAFVYDKLRSNPEYRRDFIDKFLNTCDSSDLVYINEKLDEFKKDFFTLLPVELVEKILNYLDWKTLINCCQVNSNWNKKLTNCFNKLWYDLCIKNLPLNELANAEYEEDPTRVNYKQLFVKIMKDSRRFERGKMFETWRVGPTEINAIASYKNILATATHIVKFWRMEESPGSSAVGKPNERQWTCFKTLNLESRASNLKFNEDYLLASTYFLSVDLYSLRSNQFLFQYMGHTCSISCFDFNQDLMMIATGSADNTIKYWSMYLDNLDDAYDMKHSMNKLLIKTELNLLWPVRILIEPYNDENQADGYLLLALCVNGFLFLNYIEKVEDFGQSASNHLDRFGFQFKLKISDTYKSLMCLQSPQLNLSDSFELNEELVDNELEQLVISNKSCIDFKQGVNSTSLVTVFTITENNPNQTVKMFIRQWKFRKNLQHQMFEFSLSTPFVEKNNTNRLAESDSDFEHLNSWLKDDTNDYLSFLNKRTLNSHEIEQFEIISFGFNYCILLDDKNRLHLCNLKTRSVECMQNQLNLHESQSKIFLIMSKSSQEQFLFGDRSWLNGYQLDQNKTGQQLFDSGIPFAFAFYTQKRNELFVIGWKN